MFTCRSEEKKCVVSLFFKIRVVTHLEYLEKSGNSKVVREKSGKLKFASDFERAEELKLQLLAACGLDFGYVHH